MKVMLTGGTGFVGENLAGKLAARGDYVKCLVRKTSDIERLESLGVGLHYGDLLDFDSLLEISSGADLAFHCAALVRDWGSKEEFYRVNVEGTRNVLNACEQSGVRRVVFISSNDVVWKFDNHIEIDERYPYPRKYKHPYCETKAISEKLALKYDHEGRLETVIIRPSIVWGPRDKVILPRILRLAISEELYLIGDGNNLISLCYIENLTDAIILASETKDARGEIYFINDDIKITFSEFISRLLSCLGIKWSPVRSLPYFFAYGIASVMEAWAMLLKSRNPPALTRYAVALMGRSLNYSVEKAIRELGYRPRVSIDDGLRELKLWVDDIGGINALIELK
jgi:nucleoside-diphosphate-sugar epimerase